jgi:hypothetical protein
MTIGTGETRGGTYGVPTTAMARQAAHLNYIKPSAARLPLPLPASATPRSSTVVMVVDSIQGGASASPQPQERKGKNGQRLSLGHPHAACMHTTAHAHPPFTCLASAGELIGGARAQPHGGRGRNPSRSWDDVCLSRISTGICRRT